MTAIEPQQDGTNPRKKLYSALVGNANPEAKSHFKKFSFEQFNKRLDDEKFVEDLYQSLRDNDVVLDPKNRQPEQNYYDFIDAYVKVPTAKPAAPVAKPAAAPVAAAPIEQAAPIPSVEPMEEEEIPEVEYEGKMLPEVTATPAPYQFPERGTLAWDAIYNSNPEVGTPEYDYRIAMLNQPPSLQLGPGGYTQDMAANLPETMEKAKQSSLSPVFKDYEVAQKMMKGEVPLVTQKDVRKAQEGFKKATKEQQQAALIGSSGAELKKIRQAEREGFGERASAETEAMWEQAKNAGINIFAGLRNQMNVAALNETPMDDEEREYYTQKEYEQMYETSDKANKDMQNELYRLNISNDVLNELEKGNYSKIPEATLQTIANVGVSAIASLFTAGGSMYFQSLPDVYREGVDAIAKEQGITPEEVIRNGDDAKIVAQTAAGIIAALERAGAGRLSKSIANKGGYKAVRDYLIRKGFGKTIGRAAGLGYTSAGEGFTEYVQQGTQQLSRIASASKDTKRFLEKLPKEFFSRAAAKERLSAGVGGLVGGGGMVSIGRGVGAAFQKGPDITQFSPEVQGNEIIQEAARGYQDNIAKAEEQGRKPDAFNKRELNKLATDPESWVKGEIKYLTQTIQDNKKNNIDSKVEETKLSRANALLAQIKAEKKGMEQAALAPAQEAAQVAPEAVTAEEVQGTGRRVVVDSLEEVPAEFRDKVIEIASGPLARFGVGKKQYAYIVPAETVTAPEVVAPEAPVTETAPVTEEAPVAEETIPVAPETEEDYSFLEETELTPEEETALLAQEEAAPVAPVQVFRPELPTIQVPKPEGFAPFLRKLGYTDEEISKMTIEQQQDIATNKTEPARAESSSKVDVAKENQRVERVAEAQRKIDEEIAAEEAAQAAPSEVVSAAPAEEAAPEAPAAPAPKAKKAPAPKAEMKQEAETELKAQVQKDTLERKKDELERKYGKRFSNEETYQLIKASNGEYAIHHEDRGKRIKSYTFETEEQAKKFAEKKGMELLTISQQGVGFTSENKAKYDAELKAVEQSLKEGKTQATAPKAETKQEAPKTETKKEEAPKTEAKPVSTTPQEGATVEIPAQRAEFGTRKMVFKDGEWKQNVGGDILKVGPAVQQQAQEAFAGKEETKPAETKEGGAKESLGKRLKGDALLNAEDALDELSDNGATINPDGTVVVYHRTTKDKADAIVKNNEMFGLEDGVFFSTSEKGQAEGYGDVVVKMNVPIEQIQIDDTFGNEAHVRIPTKKANQKISVSKFAPQIAKAETKTETAQKEEGKKPSTKELASQVEDMRSLPPAKRKAAQQALEERYGKEDVAKMIEITANFTKIIDDLEQRGVVKIDCP